jgi:hypothetical protein
MKNGQSEERPYRNADDAKVLMLALIHGAN